VEAKVSGISGAAAKGKTLIFIHGWPDNSSIWRAQLQALEQDHRCICLTLPFFERDPAQAKLRRQTQSKLSLVSFSFDKLADVLLEKVSEFVSPEDPATLVVHDWGAYVGFLMLHNRPKLFKSIVAIDVGPPRIGKAERQDIWYFFLLGFLYQYYLIFAFLIAVLIPGIGARIGDAIAQRKALQLRRKHGVDPGFAGSISALAGFMYLQMHIQGIGEFLGLKRALIPDGSPFIPAVPCLFLYGKKKKFQFFSNHWKKELESKTDSSVLSLEGHHWLTEELPEETTKHIKEWLNKHKA